LDYHHIEDEIHNHDIKDPIV